MDERAAVLPGAGLAESERALLAHDLRGFLVAVLGNALLLRDGKAGPLTEAQRACLDGIVDGACGIEAAVHATLERTGQGAGR